MKSIQDKVQAIADKVNGEVYEGYSGRGMFGKKCWGVVCSHSFVDTAIRLSNKFGTTYTDQMGLDAIVYWPNLKEEEGVPKRAGARQMRLDGEEKRREEA